MLYKKSYFKIVVCALLFVSNSIFAHSPDFSNIIISKTESGQVIMQINTSLTAFQHEINFLNGEGAYKTPDEFKTMALDLFKNNFSIVINEKDTLQFKNSQIFLGHETKIVTELIGMPETVNVIQVQNNIFKDITNNQCVLIFMMDGFPKEKYTLDRDNNDRIDLEFEDGKWVQITEDNSGFDYKYILLSIGILFVVFIMFYLIKKRQTKKIQ
ncbi:hypothetical protein KO500_11755 [Cellulophaga baltica]|uniref:hypothetical protein n=1 Tax=Cellulophaga TaxID=104264 RepID=UPI001C07582A|nr:MULTISPECIES: hypothetical protein [Cellulophaga]MBU2997114.1 hypothetical protein [Cellulophaga baltica]MDO6768512.1 hypothetical protein [Cellulophaga sp. 1_MG-2023]